MAPNKVLIFSSVRHRGVVRVYPLRAADQGTKLFGQVLEITNTTVPSESLVKCEVSVVFSSCCVSLSCGVWISLSQRTLLIDHWQPVLDVAEKTSNAWTTDDVTCSKWNGQWRTGHGKPCSVQTKRTVHVGCDFALLQVRWSVSSCSVRKQQWVNCPLTTQSFARRLTLSLNSAEVCPHPCFWNHHNLRHSSLIKPQAVHLRRWHIRETLWGHICVDYKGGTFLGRDPHLWVKVAEEASVSEHKRVGILPAQKRLHRKTPREVASVFHWGEHKVPICILVATLPRPTDVQPHWWQVLQSCDDIRWSKYRTAGEPMDCLCSPCRIHDMVAGVSLRGERKKCIVSVTVGNRSTLRVWLSLRSISFPVLPGNLLWKSGREIYTHTSTYTLWSKKAQQLLVPSQGPVIISWSLWLPRTNLIQTICNFSNQFSSQEIPSTSWFLKSFSFLFACANSTDLISLPALTSWVSCIRRPLSTLMQKPQLPWHHRWSMGICTQELT